MKISLMAPWAPVNVVLMIVTCAFLHQAAAQTCEIIPCAMDDCCGEGTSWDLEIQYCVPDPSSRGWNGTHAVDYTNGCLSRVCAEADCCYQGTRYDKDLASCLLDETALLPASPSKSPTGSPTVSPTESPTASPTESPVSGGTPSSQGACETANVTITYSGAFDTLILEGFTETQVSWSVSGTSPFTVFEFTLPYANEQEIPEIDNYVLSIPFIPKDTSTVEDTTLTVQGRQTVASCPNKAKVHMSLPRTCLRLCIDGKCRPVLCPLSYETDTVTGMKDVSFAPSNTELLFGASTDCSIVEPPFWEDWINEQFGEESSNIDMASMYFLDSDGDGLSNIIEYYGHRISSMYGSNTDLFDQPSQQIEFSSAFTFSGFCPAKRDTDFDLLADAYEWLYGFDAAVIDDITLDSDGDGLSNFEEQKYSTDPFNADSDLDEVSDIAELVIGSDPLSNKEKETTIKTVPITLRVGDHSGSNSERYIMRVGDIEHQSPEFGEVSTAVYNFTAGTYEVQVSHRDSTRARPDYDYVALITWPSFLLDFNIRIDDPEELLGRWLGSDVVDRTVGKKARLIIEETSSSSGSCSFDSCITCNENAKCEWNERSGACRHFDASLGYTKAVATDCACAKCREWAKHELLDREWISELPQCPCNVEIDSKTKMLSVVSATDAIWTEDPTCSAATPYGDCKNRPGAAACIISTRPKHGTAQQCCYSKQGSTFTYIQHGDCGAGTPDKKMRTVSSILAHYNSDVLTYENCCETCEEGKCGASITPTEVVTACELYKGRSDGTPGARSDERGCI